MPRDDAYLLDILLHARDAMEYVKGMNRQEFVEDSRTYNAVIRCLEVIGEAVKRLSPDTRARFPEIPWSLLARMRDFLIHAYDRVNLDQIWDTLQEDLPDLVQKLEQMMPKEDEN